MSSQKRKVLVMGVGRSGTTSIYSLLQNMFDDQYPDQTDYVYEPFLWDRKTFNKPYLELTGDFKRLASVSIEGVYHHKNMPLFCDSTEVVSAESLAWLKNLFAAGQRNHSLVKMIRGNGRIELIRRLVPDLKIIVIFRNPLDVINSSKNLFSFFGDQFHESDHRRFIEELEASGTTDKSGKGVYREFHYWESMCNHLVSRYSLDEDLFLPISHEQFVAQRNHVVQKICDFTGLEFREDYVTGAEHQVGPTQYSNNNLTVQEYLFLENHLGRYSDMVAKLTSFDMHTTINRTREKFITTEFANDSTENTEYFTSAYSAGLAAEQQRQLSKLNQHLADAQSIANSSKERGISIQEKESQLELYRQLLQKLEAELRQNKSGLRSSDAEVTKRDAIIQQISSELSARDARIVSMENALLVKTSLIQKHEQESTALNVKLRKFEEDLSARVTALRMKDQELANATSRVLELETLLAETQENVAEKNAEVLKLKQELSARAAAFGNQDQELANATSRTHELQTLLTATQKKVAEQDAKLLKLREDLSARAAAFGSKDQELANATSRTHELQTLLTATQKKVAGQDAKLLKLREDLSARAAAFRSKEQEQTNTTLPLCQKTDTTDLDNGIQARIA